jgi:hypothetical protein
MGDTTAGVPRDPKDVGDFMADVLIDAMAGGFGNRYKAPSHWGAWASCPVVCG